MCTYLCICVIVSFVDRNDLKDLIINPQNDSKKGGFESCSGGTLYPRHILQTCTVCVVAGTVCVVAGAVGVWLLVLCVWLLVLCVWLLVLCVVA